VYGNVNVIGEWRSASYQ